MPNARFSMLDRADDDVAGQSADDLRQVAFRGGGFSPKVSRYAGLSALAAAVALWQVAGSLSLINPVFLPTPLAIARALVRLASSGALWQHLAYSVLRIGSGWLIGTVAGI